MAKNDQKRPKKVSEKYRSITKQFKKVQILALEAAEKCLKMIGINAKGPTVPLLNRFVYEFKYTKWKVKLCSSLV